MLSLIKLKMLYTSWVILQSVAIGIYGGIGCLGWINTLQGTPPIPVTAALGIGLIVMACISIVLYAGVEMDSLIVKIKKEEKKLGMI